MPEEKSRLAGLTAEEQELYKLHHSTHRYGAAYSDQIRVALESLSRSRALLKKHEWIVYDAEGKLFYCVECEKSVSLEMLKMYRGNITDMHFPKCALAAELAGTGGE